MAMLIGRKLGMTQIYEESGKVTPVTVIEAGPCPILQIKTAQKEGYSAIQIGFDETRESRVTGPMNGVFRKAGVKPLRMLREVRVDDTSGYKVGDSLNVKVFEGAKKVHVTGRTKGRGFTGTTKRHNFRTGRMTHGNTSRRAPGSVGSNTTPARILKGKRMAGRLGYDIRTMRNLSLVQIDAENNLLFIEGAIPGANNGLVFVRTA